MKVIQAWPNVPKMLLEWNRGRCGLGGEIGVPDADVCDCGEVAEDTKKDVGSRKGAG